MLWLALHFPRYALEALPLRASPSAVMARGRIVLADAPATAAGILPGQRVSTALGLLPGLHLHECDPLREQQALTQLACWAGRFTPTVSLAPPSGLLLEIGGCRRLFGGLGALVDAVDAGCREQGWSLSRAVAPTPLAARWLAQAGRAVCVEDMAGLLATGGDEESSGALADLPCASSGWPAQILQRLESFGLHRLGDLLKQPAGSLRRRIGNAAVDDLCRARGELPDPQLSFVFPERFSNQLELPSRVELASGLRFAAQRLFAALAGWLQIRQCLVQACTLVLTHDDGSTSALPLRFAEPCADQARFQRLLGEHLEQRQLAAPVEALRLDADELVPRRSDSAPLFDAAPAGAEGAAACIERLRARLGAAAVQALTLQADHRPECTMQTCDAQRILSAPAASTAVSGSALRPLWLLPLPQALTERGDGPYWHGPLQLLSRSERLESGWWDSGEAGATGDVRRDYFVARNPLGQWLWIFRDRQGWYLQGLFA